MGTERYGRGFASALVSRAAPKAEKDTPVRTRTLQLVIAFSLLVTLLVAPRAVGGAPTPAVTPVTSPCGSTASGTYTHVVWIMLENVGYSVVNSPQAPYFNELVHECGLATNYLAVAHPSLPNYIALTSGSTQGITQDGEPNQFPLHVPSIFSELGSNWRTYAESMPTSCGRVTTNLYAARHNPAVYYTNVSAACRQNDVPYRVPPTLNAAFTIIVPNICDDMHSCPVTVGDAWLRRMVPLILESPQYRDNSLVMFITFDENDSQSTNRVPTLVVAPSVPRGVEVRDAFTHYSLLRTTEQLLHIGLLGRSRSAPSMLVPFHLAAPVGTS